MYERFCISKKRLRQSAAVCLAVLLLLPVCGWNASAAQTGRPEAAAKMLIPVGHTVGIKLFSKGVLVVKQPEAETPARTCGLEEGDVILKCGGVSVESSEQFQQLLQASGGSAVDLQVRRENRQKTLTVTPEQTGQGTYAIGAWIRDSMAGIGTMTFYDPETTVFGALGHGINDVDTAQLLPFASGTILPSTVKAVKMGVSGAAGELKGDFQLETELGELYANTNCGIFGTMKASDWTASLREAVPVAERAQVHQGKATILSNVAGDEVKEYDVEITRLLEDPEDPRDLLLTVTDPELKKTTGGIVQGMSGSPILQDGRLVGAVTHVWVCP